MYKTTRTYTDYSDNERTEEDFEEINTGSRREQTEDEF